MTSGKTATASKKTSKAEESSEATETQELYNVNDGLHGRNGGPYLDQVQAQVAEVNRAFIEDREPDLQNPGLFSGTVAVPAAVLVSTYNPVNFQTAPVPEGAKPGEITAQPVAEVPVVTLEEHNFTAPNSLREQQPAATAQGTIDDPNSLPADPQTTPDDVVIG